MLVALACALVSMAVAAAAPSAVLRVAPWKLPKLRMLRYVLLVGALAFLLTVFVTVVFGMFAVVSAWAPPVIALAVTLTVVAISVRTLLPFRRAQALAGALAADPTRGEARRELLALASSTRPADERSYRVFASLVLTVVSAFAEARLWEDAAALLGTLDVGRLSPGLRQTHAISLANCKAYLGDARGARDLLAAMPRPLAFPALEPAAATSEALLLALTGDPREALSRVEALPSGDPKLARAHHITRAHAYEALGRTEEARLALRRLRESFGEDGLLRVQASNGPASPLAVALLTTRDTPYRG